MAWRGGAAGLPGMEQAVAFWAVLQLTVVGLSHVAAPRAWVSFFVWLHGKGEAGVLVVGGMSLAFGALIVAFHNVWAGAATVLTLLGWAQGTKGTLYLVFRASGCKCWRACPRRWCRSS